MPFTNFPNGVTSFGAPIVPGTPYAVGFNGPGSTSKPGSNVYFVNSVTKLAADAGGSNGTDPSRPFKTLNYALTQTVNNNGDVIYVGPQHVESVVAAGGLTFPTGTAAGVTVIFQGNEVDRATIAFGTATTATMTIPAANVTLVNPLFTNSIDALAAPIRPTAADFTMIGAEYRDGSATNTLIQILTTSAATRLKLLGYRYFEDQVGGGTQKTEAVRIVGGAYQYFYDVNIQGSFSTGTFNNITTAYTSATWDRCKLGNTNAANLCIATLTTSTGYLLDTLLSFTATRAITAAHILSADMASGQCVPGATPTVIGHA